MEIVNLVDLTFELAMKILHDRYESINKVYENPNCNERLLHELLEYLENYKYPIESFSLHFSVSKYFKNYAKNMTPDLTVLNVESMEPLAFFKVVEHMEELVQYNFLEDAYHMNKHDKVLLDIPYYIVTRNCSNGKFEFFNLITILNRGNFSEKIYESNRTIIINEPYGYDVLQANDRNRLYHNKVIKKDKLLRFSRTAFYFVVPISSIALLILDASKIYRLSQLRLVVFGIIILSLLIPYLAQISIKDFSISFKEDRREKTESLK